MILSFDIPKKNKKLLDRLLPKYPMVIKKNTNWDELVKLGLHNLGSLNHTIYGKFNEEKLPLLLGETTISFNDLKEKMILQSKKLYKKAKKRAEKDYSEPWEEVKKLKNLKKILKSLTEEEFHGFFKTITRHEKFNPYLYRLELSLYDTLFPDIFNYLVCNKVEVFDNFGHHLCTNDEIFEEVIIDENEIDLNIIKQVTTYKLIDDIIVAIENVGEENIDIKTLFDNLINKVKYKTD